MKLIDLPVPPVVRSGPFFFRPIDNDGLFWLRSSISDNAFCKFTDADRLLWFEIWVYELELETVTAEEVFGWALAAADNAVEYARKLQRILNKHEAK